MLRTSKKTIEELTLAAAECGEHVLVPVKMVDDIVHDLVEAHRRDRELAEACARLESRPITLARRSA